MHFIQFVLGCLVLLGPPVAALDVPNNLKDFYDTLNARNDCTNKLATGFYSTDDGPDTLSYCGDQLCNYNVVYLQGKGTLADMDVDCDGKQNSAASDGRCKPSLDTQAMTSFDNALLNYNQRVTDLDAYIHPYVVFGNVGRKHNWKTFNPRDQGIEPLSVMAVICSDQLFYGVWGDENGDDGDRPMVGEVSLALATACFGKRMNGDNGHEDNDVLYIAFPGEDAVPGPTGANWSATSFDEFHDSIRGLGDRLIQRIPSGQDHEVCSGLSSSRSKLSGGLISVISFISIASVIL